MINKIKEHPFFIKHKKYFRFLFFCFVGGTAALIHFFVFNFFRFFIGLDFIFSFIFGILFSIIYNFSMNRNITFSARGHPLKKQIPKYLTVYASSITANFLVTLSVKRILGEGALLENLALLAGIAVSIPISFFGSLLWAFRKK